VHRPKPDLVRRFKLSNDPKFVEKRRGVVSPASMRRSDAVVLSLDETLQIEALESHAAGGR
jgi:hypothetical protein